MSYLVAQGLQPTHRWRNSLPPDAEVQVGRDCDPWSVSWDPHISRQHARLICRGERVDVQLLPGARNPLFHRGRAVTSCTLRGGESFVIGSTTFTFEHSA
ncbi:MAG: FHA domain-containing protein, partial [Pirellulales bacterium]